jgi:hypothetical protein
MSVFEGFLDDIRLSHDTLFARFVAPGFDPETAGSPIMHLELREPVDSTGMYRELLQVQQRDPDCYVSIVSEQQVTLITDHGNEVKLLAKAIAARYTNYEARDYERIAKQAYRWGESQTAALTKHMRCLAELRSLVEQQQARVLTKAQGHEVGSTARTLYEQQLSFLARLAAAAEA